MKTKLDFIKHSRSHRILHLGEKNFVYTKLFLEIFSIAEKNAVSMRNSVFVKGLGFHGKDSFLWNSFLFLKEKLCSTKSIERWNSILRWSSIEWLNQLQLNNRMKLTWITEIDSSARKSGIPLNDWKLIRLIEEVILNRTMKSNSIQWWNLIQLNDGIDFNSMTKIR
jgi:hypothetical protein